MIVRRFFGILVLALVAAACAGDDADTTTAEPPSTSTASSTTVPVDGSTTSSTEPVALTASWTGVTEDTIRLGVVTIDYAQLREPGFVAIDPGDPQVVLDAYVAELNGRGGILGRRVEAHLETVLPIGTTEAEEACLRLTEDLEVFAVLGAFEGLAQEANPCITDLHETIQVGGAPTPEQLDRARAPWISDRMGAERRMTGAVALMDDADLFGERIAVAAVADEQRLAEHLVIAELQR